MRVRYAPSPTGALHIGGARTALFNFLFARHHGGAFVLRIEDTDQSRQVPESEAKMLAGLKSLGIVWDEGPDIEGAPYGPYRVSERLGRHRELAEALLASGQAYRCFCTPEQLEADREALRQQGLPPRYVGRCRDLSPEESERRRARGDRFVVRLKTPDTGETVVHDLIRGEVAFDNRVFDDFVIMKADFTPVYNFAVAIDDHDMAISHVIRGEEHLSNTPKQIFVYQALHFPLPAFAHLPMILAPDRSKISKRHGATAVEEYQAQGIILRALTNYLLLLGWSSPDGREILDLEDAIQSFTLDRVQRTAAIYDIKKLEWMNHQYMVQLPVEDIVALVQPFLTYPVREAPPLSEVVALCRERATTLVQLADQIRVFYHPPESYEAAGVAKHFGEEAASRLEALAARLAQLEPWDHDHLAALYDALSAELGVKRAALIHPTRLAVTGRTVGPGLFELVALLGREATVERLNTAVQRIRSQALLVE